jgi:hypothetical protein
VLQAEQLGSYFAINSKDLRNVSNTYYTYTSINPVKISRVMTVLIIRRTDILPPLPTRSEIVVAVNDFNLGHNIKLFTVFVHFLYCPPAVN